MISRRRRGDALAFKSDDWNQIADYINAQTSAGVNAPPGGSVRAEGVVLIKNNTGGALGRFQPVALLAPLIMPATNEAEFLRVPAFTVSEIAGNDAMPGKFAVLLESVASGQIGRAAISGVHALKINGTTAGGFVRTASGALLASAPTGLVPIIWREAGSGTRPAIIALDHPSAPTTMQIEIDAVITGSTAVAGAANRWRYEWEEVTPNGQFPATVSGGRTHTNAGFAYNTIESNNVATGVQGNGVNVDDLPGTMGLRPIGDGAWVRMRGPFDDEDTSADVWLFQAVNAIDGDCE
jgi:hypothetical protein